LRGGGPDFLGRNKKKRYAWSYIVDDSGKRKFIAVLHQDPIRSPVDAVTAFIVSEYKK